jgi:hypothetical protein
MTDEELYGASMTDRLKLILEWAPLLAKLEAVGAAPTPHDKAIAIVAIARMLAEKSATTVDNTVCDHVEKILRTPEGQALVDWFVLSVAGGAA